MPNKTITNNDLKEIARLYAEEELTQSAIAERFNVTQPAIYKYLKMMGIPTRRTWAKKTRVCRGECGRELPIIKFGHGKNYICKNCRSSYDRQNGWGIRYRFGITREQYEQMLKDQNGVCAICGKAPDDNGKELAVDHCHETGDVRGLLCVNCNVGIGMLGSDIDILHKAIKYLS